jgi:hypothetical protein
MKRWISFLTSLFLLVSCAQVATETPEPTIAAQTSTPTEGTDQYAQERQLLIEEIKAMGVIDEEVLRVMASVPRHEFVLPEYLGQAYENHPLPIGYGQTISQPYIVAWMTELLELQPGEKVLEIGTGIRLPSWLNWELWRSTRSRSFLSWQSLPPHAWRHWDIRMCM